MSNFEIWKKLYESGTLYIDPNGIRCTAGYTNTYMPYIEEREGIKARIVFVEPYDKVYMKQLYYRDRDNALSCGYKRFFPMPTALRAARTRLSTTITMSERILARGVRVR